MGKMGIIHRAVVASIFIALGLYVLWCPDSAQAYMKQKIERSLNNTKALVPDDLKNTMERAEKHPVFDFKKSMTHYFLGGLAIFVGICILTHLKILVFIFSLIFLLIAIFVFYPYDGWRNLPIEELRIALCVLTLYFNMLIVVGADKNKPKVNLSRLQGKKGKRLTTEESEKTKKSKKGKKWQVD